MYSDGHRAFYSAPLGSFTGGIATQTWIREPLSARAVSSQPQSARSLSPLSARSVGTSHHWQLAPPLPQRPCVSGEPALLPAGRIVSPHEHLSSPRTYRARPWHNVPCPAAPPPMVSSPRSLHTPAVGSCHTYPVSYEVPPATQRTQTRWDDCFRMPAGNNFSPRATMPPNFRLSQALDDCFRMPADNSLSPRAPIPHNFPFSQAAAGDIRRSSSSSSGFALPHEEHYNSRRRSNSTPVLPPEGPAIPVQQPCPMLSSGRATPPQETGFVSPRTGGAMSSMAQPMERAGPRLYSSSLQSDRAHSSDRLPVSTSSSVLWGETLHQPSARLQVAPCCRCIIRQLSERRVSKEVCRVTEEQQRPSLGLSIETTHSPRISKEPISTAAIPQQHAPQIELHNSAGGDSPKNSVWKRMFEGAAQGEKLVYSQEKSAFVSHGSAAASAGMQPLASDTLSGGVTSQKHAALPRLHMPSGNYDQKSPVLRSAMQSPSSSSLASGLPTTAPNSERAIHTSPEVAEPEMNSQSSQVTIAAAHRTAEAIFLGVMEAAGSSAGVLSRAQQTYHSLDEVETSQPPAHSARSSTSLHDVVGKFGKPPGRHDDTTLQQARPQDRPPGRMPHALGIPESFNKDLAHPHVGSASPYSPRGRMQHDLGIPESFNKDLAHPHVGSAPLYSNTQSLPAPDGYMHHGTDTMMAPVDLSCSSQDAVEKSRRLPPAGSFPSTAACHTTPDPQDVGAVALADEAVQNAASAVSMKALRELRSFRQPPAMVCQIVDAASCILGFSDLTWATSKLRLDSAFLQLIKSFTAQEAAQCPQGRVEKFFQHMQAPAFQDDDLREKCPAAKPLASWCTALFELLTRLKGRSSAPASLGGRNTQEMGTSRADLPSDPRVKRQASSTRESDRQPCGSQREAKEAPDLGGLLVDPPLWQLDEEELSHVKDLLVGRENVGFVVFHGETDCRGFLQILPSILLVEHGEIVVYPDSAQKPPLGKGLNKPASVVLYGCMPKPRTRLTDGRAQERYRQRVAEMTEEKGAIFEDYDCNTGTWKFRVNNF